MGKKWPVQMNLPFLAVKAYVPGGSRIRPKKIRKMPSGGGIRPVPVQKFTFPVTSAPNHKSQVASDLKSRSPNRKNFPQIAV